MSSGSVEGLDQHIQGALEINEFFFNWIGLVLFFQLGLLMRVMRKGAWLNKIKSSR